MAYVVNAPADPDCTNCHGTGFRPKNPDYPSTDKFDPAYLAIVSCECRSALNREKTQERCDHDWVCRRCGLTRAGLPAGTASG